MSEEKQVESTDEDEVIVEDEEKSEEEGTEEDKDEKFSKEEFVPASKYNQMLRKQREMEAEKRELEKKINEASVEPVKQEEEDDDDDFFKEEKEEKKEVDPSLLIDEKLKPVLANLDKREKDQRRKDRDAFFDIHPEYAENGEKFQALLDEMENSINPNSTDDYYVQLEKTHRILAGDVVNLEVENKKKEIASDASSSDSGADKGSIKEEFTAEDRKLMRDEDISEDAMRALKEKLATGSMKILS